MKEFFYSIQQISIHVDDTLFVNYSYQDVILYSDFFGTLDESRGVM